MDKFEVYVAAVHRRMARERWAAVHDTAAAIAGALSAKREPFEKYVEQLEKLGEQDGDTR